MKWDLFNPPPEFNYTNMATKLDIASLENPYIQIIWEDTPENFTQERIKSVKQYFQKKYNSTNINVITKVKTTEETQQTVDVSVNIMDKNYQKELIKSLLESKGLEELRAAAGRILDEQTDDDGVTTLTVELALEDAARFAALEVSPPGAVE